MSVTKRVATVSQPPNAARQYTAKPGSRTKPSTTCTTSVSVNAHRPPKKMKLRWPASTRVIISQTGVPRKPCMMSAMAITFMATSPATPSSVARLTTTRVRVSKRISSHSGIVYAPQRRMYGQAYTPNRT